MFVVLSCHSVKQTWLTFDYFVRKILILQSCYSVSSKQTYTSGVFRTRSNISDRAFRQIFWRLLAVNNFCKVPSWMFGRVLNMFLYTNTKTPRRDILFSFRAKQFNSYYVPRTNSKGGHSLKHVTLFKRVCLYLIILQLPFIATVFLLSLQATLLEIHPMQTHKHLRNQGNRNYLRG